MPNYLFLTPAGVKNISQALVPQFLGEKQVSLVAALDRLGQDVAGVFAPDFANFYAFIAEIRGPTGASAVGLTDIGNFYTSPDVEGVLQELGPARNLRTDLASSAVGQGANLVAFRDTLATNYLKTVSDINNGDEVSIIRFINPTQHANIRNRTSVYDCTTDINTAFASDARALLIPAGIYNYSGNLLRTGAGLALAGVSHAHSVLRALAPGGIQFDGGSVTGINHNMPKLDLSNLRFEAAVENAGTAVSMTYTGGTGTPPLGPVWENVVIVPATEALGTGNPGFTRGVYGFNVRDMHARNITIAGNSTTATHPLDPTMTEGWFMDGDSDAIEQWLQEFYCYYLQTGIKIRNHEGVYIDRFTSLAIWHGIEASADQPEPTAHITNSYIGSERTGLLLDMFSYFDVHGNTFNPTAPVPNANYRGVVLDRSAIPGESNQTNFGSVHHNKFIGVGYSTSTAFTETGVDVISCNTTDIVDNDFFDFNTGVRVADNVLNVQLRVKNRYFGVDTPETIPRATRYAIGGDIRMRATGSNLASFPVNTDTKLTMGTQVEDKGGDYYDAPGGFYRPPAGVYRCDLSVRFISGIVADDYVIIQLRRDGVTVKEATSQGNSTGVVVVQLNGVVDASSTSEFDLWVHVIGASGTRQVQAVDSQTYWEMTAVQD